LKQNQNSPTKSKPTAASSTKRKRDSSPTPEVDRDPMLGSSHATIAGAPGSNGDDDKPKKAKTTKELTKEDSKTIVKASASPSKRKPVKVKSVPGGNAKISSFFGKA